MLFCLFGQGQFQTTSFLLFFFLARLHCSVMVMSCQKSSGAARDMMLSVMTSFFTPAARAASSMRVVPVTAVYKKYSINPGGQKKILRVSTDIQDHVWRSSMGKWGRDVDNSVDSWNMCSAIKYDANSRSIPFTAATKSDVTRSSMTTVENLLPKDSWLLLTRATLWLRTALITR